jgi:hypothetical protein
MVPVVRNSRTTVLLWRRIIRSQADRPHEHPGEPSGLAEQRSEIPPGALDVQLRSLEVLTRLERDGDTCVGATEDLHGQSAAPQGRINDLHAVSPQALEDDEVREFPVEDRRGRQVFEVIEVRGHTPCAQAIPLRRLGHGQRVDAVAVGACHLAHLVERHLLAVVGKHHRQTGSTAVGQRHLPDPGHSPAH